MIQNNCKIIGLTGSIGTGKSTVTNILIQEGYVVIDADKIARQVVEIGKPAYNSIVQVFGRRILLQDKTINRKKLGRLIFSSSSLRNVLNDIVHPYILQEIKNQIDHNCKTNKILFADIPLLIEGIHRFKENNVEFDEIWLVYTDEETQLKRLMERDILTRAEALNKINSQMKIEDKKNKVTRIIDNSSDLPTLKENLYNILRELQ